VRGIPRRLGNLSLRDLVPFGAFGRSGTKPRQWKLLRTGRPAKASLTADHVTPDRHVLDYRVLDGLRLVFGDMNADH
jgi:hypothetical protein